MHLAPTVNVVRRLLVIASVGVLVGGAAPLVAAEALYLYGLHHIDEPPPVAARALPAPVMNAFWLAGGERLPATVERLAPWKYGWAVAYDGAWLTKRRPGEQMASLAARAWMSRQPRTQRTRWAVTSWAATVWASRHWDAGQMTRFWVEGAWFGRGARGLDAASERYFGRASSSLTWSEVALLAALTAAPARLDPACFPDRATKARNGILAQLRTSGALTPADHDAAVAQPLGVRELPCDRRGP